MNPRLVDASVDAFWSFESTGAPHRVIPDGCMDALFDLSTGQASVVGAMSRATLVRAPRGAHVFGVRFRPGRASLFVDAVAGELRDASVPLEALVGRAAARLTEQVLAARTDEERARVSAAFVHQASSRVRGNDARVDRATRAFEQTHGRVPVSDVAEIVGLSERQLERVFRERVGVRPKFFARVQRMQHAVRLLSQSALSGAALAAAAGYADEPHLLRDFRALCGTTPWRLAGDVGFVQSPADDEGLVEHP
jgi:methylphosphotriester-DNA--protein-cysteine methyltransferase